jgi:hypothetical protein
MIIWGSRAVTRTLASGDFYCPHCEQRRAYALKEVRRFFTLYFVPLVPMQTLGEHIECDACKNTYKPTVLQYDPDARRKAFNARFKAVTEQVLYGMTAFGAGPLAEKDALVARLVNGLTGSDASVPPASRSLSDAALKNQLGELAQQLTDQGREGLIRAAFRVAGADGAIDSQAQSALVQIASGLGITAAHYQGIVAEMAGGHQ